MIHLPAEVSSSTGSPATGDRVRAYGQAGLWYDALDAAYQESSQPPDPEGAIIPVSVWRTVDWSGSCLLDRMTVQDENFTDVLLTLNNSGGVSSTEVNIPDFFDGTVNATLDIDASAEPVQWRIVPDLARADSTSLMEFLNRRMRWIAPLAYSGEITMTGNTKEELVRSVRGKTTFDGGEGRIDIAQIKKPLLALATRTMPQPPETTNRVHRQQHGTVEDKAQIVIKGARQVAATGVFVLETV